MNEATELKDRIEQERRTGAGHGQHPFSAELRREAIAYIRKERRSGSADHVISDRLGVSLQTLSRWAGRRWRRGSARRTGGALVPVTIARAVQSSLPSGGGDRAMIVAGPAQMRVAGLTLDELVELWRRLAC